MAERIRAAFTLLMACLVLNACGPAGMPREPDQLTIYHNGVVLTIEANQPTAEATAIRGDSIVAVGTDQQVLALEEDQTTVIDLDGRTLMPGFVDAHTHVFNDRGNLGLSLDEAQDLALRNGITTLADLFADRGTLRELQQFAADDFLRVRTSLYLVAADNCGRLQGDWYQETPPTRVRGEMLRIGGVKLFADGGTCGEPFSCTEPFGLGVPEPYQSWDQPIASTRATNPDLHLAWSIDTPYGSEYPLVHLFGFVTRNDLYQGQLCAAHPWHQDDVLPVDEALSIMTIQAAYVLFREDEVGSLEPGKLADLIVLSDNPRTIEPDQLPFIQVLLTVVGGSTEYCQPSSPNLCPDFTNRIPVH